MERSSLAAKDEGSRRANNWDRQDTHFIRLKKKYKERKLNPGNSSAQVYQMPQAGHVELVRSRKRETGKRAGHWLLEGGNERVVAGGDVEIVAT